MEIPITTLQQMLTNAATLGAMYQRCDTRSDVGSEEARPGEG